MKSKISRKGLTKLIVVMLIFIMIATSACSGLINTGSSSGPVQSGSDSATGNIDHSVALDNLNKDLVLQQDTLSDDDRVNYIIEVSENSLYTMYEGRKDTRISYQDYVASRSSRINSENMSKKHKALYSQIAKKVDARFVVSYTGIMNAFAVNIKYGDRELLKTAAMNTGAVSVSISERYEKPEVIETASYTEVSNEVPAYDTGIFKRPEGKDGDNNNLAAYQGEGMVVAVLDTGLDYEHDAFTSVDNLPTKIVDGAVVVDDLRLKFKENHLDDKLNLLVANDVSGNIKSVVDEGYLGSDVYEEFVNKYQFSDKLSASEVYVNKKVPYAYDYADFDPEVNTSQENSHGTHVSGIIVGRSDTPYLTNKNGDNIDADGNVTTDESKMVKRYDAQGRQLTGIEGVAPLAQIVFMKIFSDFSAGAEDIFVYAALEDCATLGVDVINLSIGRGSGFSDMEDNKIQQNSFEKLSRLGINVIVAASNGYSSGFAGGYGSNLLSNPDSATLGSPSSITENFSVASINGVKSRYMMGKDAQGGDVGAAYFHESSKGGLASYDFIKDLVASIKGDNKNEINYSNTTAYTANGTAVPYLKEIGVDDEGEPIYDINVPFEIVAGYGRPADYGSTNVTGKIALISRGVTTFVDKLQTAKNKGAIGVVCYNNVGGVITMALDENEIRIPSCSITMDDAAPLKELQRGVFYINNDLKAGPFMSEFSSWGPIPSLELKPEITGHGGEIYSSYPGNNYNRISGTSMACPNIAGLTLLARQHITTTARQNQDIYPGITGDGSEEDNRRIQTIIYQMMMSTATMPLNKENNPYSPRKVGAGLSDINAMLRTRAYIITKDAENNDMPRSKIELFDDPEKTGEYLMSFYVRNISDTDYEYEAESFVFTESVASDKKTVAEKAYMLEGTREWKVNDAENWTTSGKIRFTAAKANGSEYTDTKVTLRVKLSDNDKTYLKTFVNGMYVEGFVRLTSKTDDVGAQNLGVPFLAFYGDWYAAPILDQEIYFTDPENKDTSKDEDQKTYAQGRSLQAYGRFEMDGSDYVLPLGPFLFQVPEDSSGNPLYDIPVASYDRTVLSLSQNSLNELYFVTGFLRGARKVDWTVRDKTTGQLMDSGDFINIRKDAAASNVGGLAMDLKVGEIGCKNGGTYVFELTAVLDPNADKVNPSPTAKERGSRSEKWSFEFSVDTDAPIITDSQLRVEKSIVNDSYNYFLDIYIHDDFYAQAMTLNIYNKSTGQYESVWEEGLRPIGGDKNSTTRISYNITNAWDRIKSNEYKVSTQLYDYAFNSSHYEIDLSKQLHTAAHDTLAFGDIGTYSSYTRGNRTLKVFSSEADEIKYNADGTFVPMTEIYVVKNQSINLGKAVVTDKNVWPEDLIWSSDQEDVEVSTKGEIFVKGNDSTQDILAKITVTSKETGLSATISVWVLSDKSVADYSISKINENTTLLSDIHFASESRYVENAMKAGERYDVEVELYPWFTDTEDITIEWTVQNPLYATIRTYGSNSLRATIIARQGVYEGEKMPNYDRGVHSEANAPVLETLCAEDYISNFAGGTEIYATVYRKNAETIKYTARLYVYVDKEFVANGPQLLEYNGTRADVVIPESLELTSIAPRVFLSNNKIETIVLPEGLERIGMAAFAYCPNLRKVEFSSSVRTIGQYAFMGSYSARDGLNTSLQILDTSKIKEPLHIESKAFVNNPVLGTNAIVSRNAYIPEVFGANFDLIDSLLDTSKFRVIGERAFAGSAFLSGELDLSNVRTMGESAFYNVGILAKDGRGTLSVILGEKTDIGENGLGRTGVEILNVYAPRLNREAFKECEDLTTVTFHADNTYINDSAFLGCSKLATVEFKGSVSYIGVSAFQSTGIRNLEFRKGARYIDDYAFNGAPLMQELVLPLGLEYVGTDAFSGYVSLLTGDVVSNITTLVIPAEFDTKIENFSAFYNTHFENIRVETGNIHYFAEDNILYYSEAGQGKLDSNWTLVLIPMNKNFALAEGAVYTLPNKVNKISDNAFSFNSSLKRVNLNNVIEVAPGAMQNMTNLEEVTLNPNMKVIPDYMFSGCTSLTTIVNTAQIESVGKYAFAGTVDEVFMIKDANGKLVDTYIDEEEEDENKKVKQVTEETVGAFGIIELGIVPITEIDLSSCKVIGEGAFSATALERFTIPDEVTEIASYAFYYCLDLENVTFHGDVTDINDYAFSMSGITSVVASGVEYVGEFAFAFPEFEMLVRGASENRLINLRPSLTEVKLSNVKYVNMHAFSVFDGGGRLNDVIMPEAKEIGAYAFEYQGEMRSINTSAATKVTLIGDYAFASTGLTEINMPNATYIGKGAFYDCANIKGTVVIPRSVQYIAPLAFAYTEISEFKMGTGSTFSNYCVIDGVLFKEYSGIVPNVTFGEEQVKIGENPDRYITKFTKEMSEETISALELTHYPTGGGRRDLSDGIDATGGTTSKSVYTIPEKTTHIAESAFSTVRTLSKVVFPESIKKIGDKAFFGSLIKTYEFTGLIAPTLEAYYDGYVVDETHQFYWAVYANFYSYFSPTSAMYSWTTPGLTYSDGKLITINSALYQYRYNTITSKSSSDTWIYGEYVDNTDDENPIIIHNVPYIPATETSAARSAAFGANNSIVGGGDMTDMFKYDLTIIRPSNGIGYTNFVYDYYFDNSLLSKAIMTDDTADVIEAINALPYAGDITLENLADSRARVNSARKLYDYLASDLKELVKDANYQKLVDCEAAIEAILATIKTFNVSFVVKDSIYGAVQTVENGGVVALPNAPAPETGYLFEGWYLNGEKFDASTPVTANMVLVARFVTSDYYTVSFRGIGVSVDSVFIKSGELVEKPENPTRDGYKFNGWYTESGKYDFSSPVEGDLTLYAEWTEKGCGCGTITPFADGGAALLAGLIALFAIAALSAVVLLRKRPAAKQGA